VKALDDTLLFYDLVAGFDYRNGVMTIAVINPDADHFPWTDDLHRFRSLHALNKYWLTSMHGEDCGEPAPRLLIAIAATDPADLQLWWRSRGATVVTPHAIRLEPFLREAANYEIPRRFHRAHALAQCAATRLRAARDLDCLAQTLDEVNYCLQQAEQTIRRLAAAYVMDL
jgi:hypothetical protein